MPTRNRNFLRMLWPFGLLAVAVLAFIRRKGDDWEYDGSAERRFALCRSGRRPAAAAVQRHGSHSSPRSPRCSSQERRSPRAPATSCQSCSSPTTPQHSRRVSPTLPPRQPQHLPQQLTWHQRAEAVPEAVPAAPEAVPVAPASEPVAAESAPAAEAVERRRSKPPRLWRQTSCSRPLRLTDKERRELTCRAVSHRRAQGTGGEACARKGQDTGDQEMGPEAGRCRARAGTRDRACHEADSESRPSGSTGRCLTRRPRPLG